MKLLGHSLTVRRDVVQKTTKIRLVHFRIHGDDGMDSRSNTNDLSNARFASENNAGLLKQFSSRIVRTDGTSDESLLPQTLSNFHRREVRWYGHSGTDRFDNRWVETRAA
jgi:hypothetical protein